MIIGFIGFILGALYVHYRFILCALMFILGAPKFLLGYLMFIGPLG